MAYSRYSKRDIVLNDDLGYRDTFFVSRDVKQVEQYTTSRTTLPTVDDLERIDPVPYTWKSNDRLYNLAQGYYGSPDLWWLIAWFNKKPTEAHFELGETIYIPLPMEEALYLFDKGQKG